MLFTIFERFACTWHLVLITVYLRGKRPDHKPRPPPRHRARIQACVEGYYRVTPTPEAVVKQRKTRVRAACEPRLSRSPSEQPSAPPSRPPQNSDDDPGEGSLADSSPALAVPANSARSRSAATPSDRLLVLRRIVPGTLQRVTSVDATGERHRMKRPTRGSQPSRPRIRRGISPRSIRSRSG